MERGIRRLASGQIFLIVLSIFAFAFIIGDVGRVSADTSSLINLLGSGGEWGSVDLTGELMFNGQTTGYFNPGVPGLAEGTPTLDILTGEVGTIGAEVVTQGAFETFAAGQIGQTVTVNGFTGTLAQSGGQWTVTNSAGFTQIVEAGEVTSFGTGGPPIPGGAEGILTQIQQGTLLPGAAGHLVSGAIYGAIAYFAGKMIAGMFGASESQAEAVGTALGVGVGLWKFLSLQAAGGTAAAPAWISASGAFWAAAGVGLIVLLVMYKNEKAEIVEFQCLPWEAPLGGEHCEDCNDDEFRPCSEYRCRSLGQACELLNPGTEEEKCTWVNPHDVVAPTIETWEDALTEGHSYAPHATLPEDRGTRIVREDAVDGCLQAFTPLEFGVLTDEPAQCKIDIIHTESLEEMSYYLDGNNYYVYEHTQGMSLPSPGSVNADNPEISEDGIYDMYIRCRDRNGNENVAEFNVNFCVDPSPDTTPPTIVETSILDGSPVAFEVGEVELEVYVNEPAECKWSVQDKNYEDMETEMSCSTEIYEMNAQQLYTCATTLTGINDREENTYYFRCKDNPNLPEEERNVNAQSYSFSLFGTEPLSILEVGPNETISGNTETIAVELYAKTDDGANEGLASCLFSPSGEEGSYIEMFESNSFEHKQLLMLTEGTYNYYFRCVDAGGNSDESNTSFVIDIDNEAPLVARAYHDLDVLKIVTDEDAVCVYSLNSCNYVFEEGLSMSYDNRYGEERVNHITEWEPNTYYYIKCKDDYENQPNPNDCSITISASSVA